MIIIIFINTGSHSPGGKMSTFSLVSSRDLKLQGPSSIKMVAVPRTADFCIGLTLFGITNKKQQIFIYNNNQLRYEIHPTSSSASQGGRLYK